MTMSDAPEPAAPRPIVLTNDLDGVHVMAPFPVMTALSLFRGRFKLPEPGTTGQEWTPPRSAVIRARNEAWRWTIRVRPFRRESRRALDLFRAHARTHDRSLRMAALTGRLRDQHEVTRAKLQASGYMDYFDDLYLNEWTTTTAWKESVVRRLVLEGSNVVHLEDDLKAALAVARTADGVPGAAVQVYLVRNASNSSRLLRRAGIELPANVTRVHSLMDAAACFEAALEAGTI